VTAGGARAVIVSGAGRYADPWHPFAETSARLAALLGEAGVTAEIDEDVDVRLADPGKVELLVVNIGNPGETGPADEAVRRGLLGHLGRGGALLAVHASATSLPGVPEWEAVLGGLWVRGTTHHPPYGRARVRVCDEAHPVTAGLGDFELDDERYTAMRVDAGVRVLADHELETDRSRHPLVWAHGYGPARVVYDALGHDAASYDSTEHCEIVRRAARWLTA
jgi:hypothetical protein